MPTNTEDIPDTDKIDTRPSDNMPGDGGSPKHGAAERPSPSATVVVQMHGMILDLLQLIDAGMPDIEKPDARSRITLEFRPLLQDLADSLEAVHEDVSGLAMEVEEPEPVSAERLKAFYAMGRAKTAMQRQAAHLNLLSTSKRLTEPQRRSIQAARKALLQMERDAMAHAAAKRLEQEAAAHAQEQATLTRLREGNDRMAGVLKGLNNELRNCVPADRWREFGIE